MKKKKGFLLCKLRFGHSLVKGIFEKFALNSVSKVGQFELHKNFFNLDDQYENGEMGKILSGLLHQVCVLSRMDKIIIQYERITFQG